MYITGTHIQYYLVCHRKLWLYTNGIQMEQTSDLVTDGKLVHENSYACRNAHYQEVQVEGIKVDYYDKKNEVIHEIKHSHKLEEAHVWQLKHYIYVFERHGIPVKSGILEYPLERMKQQVLLTDIDREQLQKMQENIHQIIAKGTCPAVLRKLRCKKCAYYDFCYAGEIEP